jgi:hypothetical protein
MNRSPYDPNRKPGVPLGVIVWMVIALMMAVTAAGAWLAFRDEPRRLPAPPTNLRIVPTPQK